MRSIFIFVIFFYVNVVAFVANGRSVEAENGILNLSDIEMNKETYCILNGEYKFYWKSLIHPDTLSKSTLIVPDCYADVPAYWTSFKNGKHFPGRGFATYSLKVILPAGFREQLTFDITGFDSSYEMFLNGASVGSSGRVGTSKHSEVPGLKSTPITYTPQSDTLQMVLWLSNFNSSKGGFWRELRVGPSAVFESKINADLVVSYVVIGFLFAFSLIFFIFFISLRKDVSMVYFSIALMGVIVRLVATNHHLINEILSVSWSGLMRWEYMSTAVIISSGFYFFSTFVETKKVLWMAHINAALSLVILILIVYLPVPYFPVFLYYFALAITVMVISVFVFSFRDALEGSLVSILNILGTLILVIAMINDLLIASTLKGIFGDFVTQYAIIALALMHAIIMVQRWVEAFNEKAELHNVVNYINTNLEKLVAERTEELNIKNTKVEKQNKELLSSLSLQNRIFSIIGHDLRSPVATLFQLAEVLEQEHNLDEVERRRIIRSLRQLSRSTGDMIDNLVFWGRSQGRELKCRPEFSFVRDVFEDLSEVLVPIAKQKGINLQFEEGVSDEAYFDKELMRLVLRNLIGNAIKFTPHDGSIKVAVSLDKDKQHHIVSVQDSGVGMDAAIIEMVLQGVNKKTTVGTKGEKGTGLGLVLCKDLIELHRGTFYIESRKGVGSRFYFTLPFKKKTSVGLSKEIV